VAQDLPPGGETEWEIEELEVFVTFLLFDPEDSAVALPKGLSFIPASEVPAPEFQEHLKKHPEQSNWVFSFVEVIRPKTWRLDGKSPQFPKDGAIGVWFAPVDHSQLAAEVSRTSYDSILAPSPDAVLVLGLWIPDRGFVDYSRARGHHAEYGMVTLAKDSSGTFHGEIRLTDLNVEVSATPHGEVRNEPDPFTQIFFEPGRKIQNVVVLAGANASERDCSAEWSKKGSHPVSRGAFVGPTFHTFEGPLRGSAYGIAGAER
jgi:hypothetical protein